MLDVRLLKEMIEKKDRDALFVLQILVQKGLLDRKKLQNYIKKIALYDERTIGFTAALNEKWFDDILDDLESFFNQIIASGYPVDVVCRDFVRIGQDSDEFPISDIIKVILVDIIEEGEEYDSDEGWNARVDRFNDLVEEGEEEFYKWTDSGWVITEKGLVQAAANKLKEKTK